MKQLPRTVAEAKAAGHKPTKVDFNEMSAQQKASWVHINTAKATHGQICSIGPGAVPGTHIVCFFDENTGACDDCHTIQD
jgi:hypothetical protein